MGLRPYQPRRHIDTPGLPSDVVRGHVSLVCAVFVPSVMRAPCRSPVRRVRLLCAVFAGADAGPVMSRGGAAGRHAAGRLLYRCRAPVRHAPGAGTCRAHTPPARRDVVCGGPDGAHKHRGLATWGGKWRLTRLKASACPRRKVPNHTFVIF